MYQLGMNLTVIAWMLSPVIASIGALFIGCVMIPREHRREIRRNKAAEVERIIAELQAKNAIQSMEYRNRLREKANRLLDEIETSLYAEGTLGKRQTDRKELSQ